ncbi:hypothetical protein ACHAWT_006432 [Skeletonema menzelii]
MSSSDPQEIIAQAIQSARYNEAVVVTINGDDGTDNNDEQQQTREIVLVACLDTENGGIIWKDAATSSSSTSTTSTTTNTDDVGIVRHLRTKRWALPMLNDHRRNEMYNTAIRSACQQKVAEKNNRNNQTDDYSSSNDDNVVRILDIGSGSGLLAMMGAKYTLDAIQEEKDDKGTSTMNKNVKDVRVTSVEMASAMARLARMTIKANDLDNHIEVVEKHSMDENFSLDQKADICTSELLESGLLGEGVLPSIRDAWTRHLKEDAVVIPHRARVFAVLVEGLPLDDSNGVDKTTENRHAATDFFGPDLESFRQASGGVCLSTSPNNGSPLLGRQGQSREGATEGILVSLHASSLLDANYNEPLSDGLTEYNDYKLIPQTLKEKERPQKQHRGIRALSQPQTVLDFDFASGLEALPPPAGESFSKQIMATSDGNCNGVLFWWELDLGDSANSTYSTKPIGFFSDSDDSKNWQDHWQQNLFLFGDAQVVRKVTGGHPVDITVSHDDTSISFAMSDHDLIEGGIARPNQRRRLNHEELTICRSISSTRALQLNDTSRIRTLREAIQYALETKGMDAPLLDLSDMGICALIAAAAGATRVTSLESSSGGIPTLAATIAQIGNNFDFQIIQAQAEHITNAYILGETADIVAAEPYFEMLEGWSLQEALNYFYLVRSMKQRGLISLTSISIPSVAIIMAVAVECDDFFQAYGQVGDSEEKILGCFDHNPVNFFGDRYSNYDVSLRVSEYKYKALSDPFCVAKLLYDEVKIEAGGEKDGWASGKITRPGNCQGAIFYLDYLCCVPKEKGTHQKDGMHYATVTTSSASHRQIVRKLQSSTVITEADVQKGTKCFCKASFEDDINGIEDHSFTFKIEK